MLLGAGSHAQSSGCFHLSGTVGQVAAGYSSSGSGTYSITAGFWPVAPTTELDEIFFNGFEKC